MSKPLVDSTIRSSNGTNDLRIASIAMDQFGIVVTKNQLDFDVIAGLTIEDWLRRAATKAATARTDALIELFPRVLTR